MGVAVAAGDRLLYERAASPQRTPASNQKLLLSMAALDASGGGYRARTRLSASRTDGDVVRGDLFVHGEGDPTFGDRLYRAGLGLAGSSVDRLARSLVDAGIRRVTGSVVGLRSSMRGDWDAPGWQPYVRQAHIARPTALSYNGNGSSATPPELQTASHLTQALERSGVEVRGPPRFAKKAPTGPEIAGISSPPLIEMIAIVVRGSWNFGAEVLNKALGAECFGGPGTIAKGSRAIAAWAGSYGSEIVANDAAGLSYENRISPRQMTELLTATMTRYWGAGLRNALPRPGEGTLTHRLAGVRVRAKTGSLFDGSSALSGWVWMESRRRWAAFSIMSSLGRSAGPIEDEVVRILSRW